MHRTPGGRQGKRSRGDGDAGVDVCGEGGAATATPAAPPSTQSTSVVPSPTAPLQGVAVWIAPAGVAHSKGWRGRQPQIAARLGARVVSELAEATHVMLDEKVRPGAVQGLAEWLAGAAGSTFGEKAPLHTLHWISHCSQHRSQGRAALVGAKRHPDAPVPLHSAPPPPPSPPAPPAPAPPPQAAAASPLAKAPPIGGGGIVGVHDGTASGRGGGRAEWVAAADAIGSESDEEDGGAEGPRAAAERGLSFKELLLDCFRQLARTYAADTASVDSRREYHNKQACGVLDTELPDEPRGSSTWRDELRALSRAHGIGDSTMEKVYEIYRTGALGRLGCGGADATRKHAMTELNTIWGVGPATAAELYAKGVRSVASARERPDLFGEDTRVWLSLFDELTQPVPYTEITEVEERVIGVARRVDPALVVRAMGSYRRGEETSGDVDLLVWREAAASDGARDDAGSGSDEEPAAEADEVVLHRLVPALHADGLLTHDLRANRTARAKGTALYHGVLRIDRSRPHRRVDIKTTRAEYLPFATMFFSGTTDFNRTIGRAANAKGYTLSCHGLRRRSVNAAGEARDAGPRLPCADEREIFARLGLAYRAPHERRGKCDVVEVETGKPWMRKGGPSERRAVEAPRAAGASRLTEAGGAYADLGYDPFGLALAGPSVRRRLGQA